VTAIHMGPGELTSISRGMLSAICHDVADYAALDEPTKRDLVSVNVRNAQLFLRVADRHQLPSDAQLGVLAAAARRRFRQGVPLPSLLRAYRIGGHELWKRVSHDRPDLDQHVLADTTLSYIDCASTVAEHAYAAEQRAVVRAFGLDIDRPHIAIIIGSAGSTAKPGEDTAVRPADDISTVLPLAADALHHDTLRDSTAVNDFVDNVLADFARHDEQQRGELIRTLHVYFTHGMNRRATARRLGVHPNTLDHRLRKASHVGGIEVTDPEVSFRFQLAIRLLPMSGRKSWLTHLR
jgi:PucR C-terminal helix-turn-helix domain